MLAISKPWTRQPPPQTRLDQSRFGRVAWLMHNLTLPANSTYSATTVPTVAGAAFQTTRSADNAGTRIVGPAVLYLTDFTAFWYGIPELVGTNAGYHSLFGTDDLSNTSNITSGRDSFTFTQNHQNIGTLVECNVAGTGGYRNITLTVNRPALIVMTRQAGTARVYVNGTQNGSDIAVGSGSDRAFENLRLGCQFFENGNRTHSTAKHVLAGIVHAAWSAAQVRALGSEPWGLFEPRRIWVPVTAAPTVPTVVALTPTTIGSTSHRPRYTWTP